MCYFHRFEIILLLKNCKNRVLLLVNNNSNYIMKIHIKHKRYVNSIVYIFVLTLSSELIF